MMLSFRLLQTYKSSLRAGIFKHNASALMVPDRSVDYLRIFKSMGVNRQTIYSRNFALARNDDYALAAMTERKIGGLSIKILKKLCQQIDSDTTIITPNRRLSATLHKIYHQYQLEQKQTFWHTPDILPLATWIQRLWENHTAKQFSASSFLLNATQEQFLWENILLSTKDHTHLLQVTETAHLTQSAWGLLKQWQIDINHPFFQSAEDYSVLNNWLKQFQQQSRVKNVLDMASLADLVSAKICSKEINLSKKIKLFGFNEESPQLKYLLNCCANTGSQIERVDLQQQRSSCQRINLPDQENEILTMARWAKNMLKINPTAIIGCVIPSLDKIRDRVQQIFLEVFDSQSNFNISAGKNLIQYPIIYAAMQLLSLSRCEITIDHLSYLLASPFVGEGEKERLQRAYFDSQLIKNNIAHLNILSHLQTTHANQNIALNKICPYLAKRLTHFFAETQQLTTLSYTAWAKCFNHLLTLLGWPGERSLNSEEYQVVENWLKILTEFGTLDYLSTPVSMNQALQTLHKLLSQTIFQAKTPDAPIQILGILEAAAVPFDYLWVSGMDDLSWPPKAKPHPLIPKRLQRELQMPHATSERELLYCKQLTLFFKRSSETVIFSHADKNEDIELQASPLIRDLDLITVTNLNLTDYLTTSKTIYLSKQIENIVDEVGPKLTANEKIHGGISILQHQALCPFKAFAEWRLHTKELEKPLPGLRPKERGTLLHKAIEILWSQLKTHSELIATDINKINAMIEKSITEALNYFSHIYSLHSQYINLEKKRLHKLLNDWLEIEKMRAPFKILEHEKTSQITLNQLTLSIRTDRIDELEDGKKLIIDYKTGRNNDINDWFSDRPEQPQLPLYSLLDTTHTVGIAFAQIFPGETYFKGISQYELNIDGIKLISLLSKTAASTWPEQLNQWHSILTKLSDDFCFGIAKVDPKEIPETCTWCGLKALCRINDEVVC